MKQKRTLSVIFAYLMVLVLMSFSVSAAQSAVNLGTAGNFAVLSKAGISTTGTTLIVGDIGVSPIDSTAITGFGLILDTSTQFSTSSIVTGKAYAADYSPPTPTTMTTAVSDMQTAYTDAAGRTLPDATELGAGDISGMTLTPGLYKWGTGVMINTGVTLDCQSNENAIFIFQIAQDLTVGNGAIVTLSGNCQAKNIFWQVAGQATLGTTADVKGIILSQTAIAMNTGAKLNGRALAQTAVTLDANAVTAPTGSAAPAPTPTPIVTPTPSPTPAPDPGSGGSSSSGGSSGGSSTRVTTPTPVVKTTTAKVTTTKTVTATPIAKVESKLPEKLPEKVESKESIIARINLRTGLSMSLSDNAALGAVLRAELSNGKYAYVKVLPAEASAKAQAVLKAKCEERNCTVELKEAKVKGEAKAVYNVKIEKKAKILGLINVKERVEADIDAETGATIAVRRPWWAFFAREEKQ